jgi:hypothetical protein
MRRFKQQQGMTTIGWLLLLVWIITISLLTVKIAPVYINSLKISSALEVIESELLTYGKTITPEEIKKILLNHFENEMLKEVTANEIIVSQGVHTYNVRIVHQLKEQMMGNWYIILIVDKSVDVPMSQ